MLGGQRAALRFYGPLLGWSFDEPAELAGGFDGEYFPARLAGSRVAGIGQAPSPSPAVWSAYVRVEALEPARARARAAGGAQLGGSIDIGSDGRLAVLADATGVPFGLWQAGERSGAELVAEPGAWAMSSLHTPDVERATVFYNTMFGWELEQVPDAPFSQWRLGGQVIGVVTATEGSAVPPHWSVNFAVGDIDAVAQHATALDVDVERQVAGQREVTGGPDARVVVVTVDGHGHGLVGREAGLQHATGDVDVVGHGAAAAERLAADVDRARVRPHDRELAPRGPCSSRSRCHGP